MISRVRSATVLGVDALPVDVEVDIALGLPYFNIVGLPEATVRESRVRVAAAIKNSGFALPERRITVNLAPADVRKEGTAFDLPIALAILIAARAVPAQALDGWLVCGELSLSGQLRPVRGALPVAVTARAQGATGLILPSENGVEGAAVEGLEVRTADSLEAAGAFLNGARELPRARRQPEQRSVEHDALDLADVQGQTQARRALEVSAAGGHNLLLVGPPGAGKTMLARRLPSLLPELSREEALETTTVYSVLGLARDRGLIQQRPFRAPHHSVSDVGLVGGGGAPRPGEVSLAHNGVLFLDELPEFSRRALETLRQPLEEGRVVLSRSRQQVVYPGRVMLVAAMNPCPCGFAGDPRRQCSCRAAELARYRGRVSGPLLDRIDVQIEVPPVPASALGAAQSGEDSATVRARVARARALQRRRYHRHPSVRCNAELTPGLRRAHATPSAEGIRLLAAVVDRLGVSARAHDRIIKVARTVADLDGSEDVSAEHVAEAISYRSLDRVAA